MLIKSSQEIDKKRLRYSKVTNWSQPSDVQAKSYSCRGTRGNWWNSDWVFDLLQYFEMILPSVESLCSSLQDEVYFMDEGAAGGLWRHQTWSPSWPLSWILSRIRNQVKTVRINTFLRLTCKMTLHHFIHKLFFYSWKNLKKLHSQMAWPPATYDIISRNHSNWPSHPPPDPPPPPPTPLYVQGLILASS